MPLFRRLNRAVELNEAGRVLRPGFAQGFDSLRQAVRAAAQLGDARSPARRDLVRCAFGVRALGRAQQHAVPLDHPVGNAR